MTPRQRWQALFERRTPDRVPTDYQATPEVTERVLRDLDCADEMALWKRLSIDRRLEVAPRWLKSETAQGRDMWGIEYRRAEYEGGAYDEPCVQPLATAETVADVHAHRWPSPDDFDYSAVTEACRSDDGQYPIHAACYEPFLLYGYLRG